MMKGLFKAATILVLLAAACSKEAAVQNGNGPAADEQSKADATTQLTVSFSMPPQTKVDYIPNGNGLNLEWHREATIGVYKHKQGQNGATFAGKIYSSISKEDWEAESIGGGHAAVRTFNGTVIALEDGESYYYMHPALQDGVTTIDYTQQKGQLGQTYHLRDLVPIVWNDSDVVSGVRTAHIQAYAMHIRLLFGQNPGRVNTVRIKTMKRSDDGPVAADKIFPKTFDTGNIYKSVNHSLARMDGTSIEDDGYTDSLSITIDGDSRPRLNANGQWECDVYLAGCSVENLNIYSSLFHIEADCRVGGTYKSDFVSFAGQQLASDNYLPMKADGGVYNLTCTMSQEACLTIMNKTKKMYSLLGMWNSKGVSFDPESLLRRPEDYIPAQLDSMIGTQEKKQALVTRFMDGKDKPEFTYEMFLDQIEVSRDTSEEGDNQLPSDFEQKIKQSDVNYNTVRITRATELYLTFLTEYGTTQNNSLLYYTYPAAAIPESDSSVAKIMAIPKLDKNTSLVNGGDSGPIEIFTTMKLLYVNDAGYVSSIFPAGTYIGFMMTEEGFNKPDAKRYYTNSKWNAASFEGSDPANWNAFINGAIGDASKGGIIPGLVIYGMADGLAGKTVDDFKTQSGVYSSAIWMISSSDPYALSWDFAKAYVNLNTNPEAGDTTLVIKEQ